MGHEWEYLFEHIKRQVPVFNLSSLRIAHQTIIFALFPRRIVNRCPELLVVWHIRIGLFHVSPTLYFYSGVKALWSRALTRSMTSHVCKFMPEWNHERSLRLFRSWMSCGVIWHLNSMYSKRVVSNPIRTSGEGELEIWSVNLHTKVRLRGGAEDSRSVLWTGRFLSYLDPAQCQLCSVVGPSLRFPLFPTSRSSRVAVRVGVLPLLKQLLGLVQQGLRQIPPCQSNPINHYWPPVRYLKRGYEPVVV